MSDKKQSAKVAITVRITTHFKKHWWKWCLLVLSVGIAFSGWSYKSGDKEIKKDGIKIPGISKAAE
jgi:hypothetical protein